MPFDSEGVFSRIHNWEDDRENDIDIVSDRHDEEDDNFADGLSQCFLKNGNSKMESNLNVGNFKITNLAAGTSSSDAVNRGQLDNALASENDSLKTIMNSLVKIGDIKASVISANHDNWLLCNGQEISRNEYADLFSLIGEYFGAGNGVTTFNVPDYRGKFLRGLGGNAANDIYTAQNEGLPNIVGDFSVSQDRFAESVSGAFYKKESGSGHTHWSEYTAAGTQVLGFDASKDDEIYGASNHVTPENYAVYYFIKAKEE